MSNAKHRTCAIANCSEILANPKHDLCYRHWKMQRDGQTEPKAQAGGEAEPAAAKAGGPLLSSTKLGQHFNLSPRRMNLILAEIGWIEKHIKGWVATERGQKVGAEVREARQTGIPFVVWPAAVTDNRVLIASVQEAMGDAPQEPASDEPASAPAPNTAAAVGTAPTISGFRERFPARFRSTDGHMVRSRAEMLIDNWLYMQGIVHAFERKLPIEEEVYCDFYLPAGKVYIEYWGLENDPKYAARKAEKQAIYQRYSLNLVELGDEEIMNLDDVLPRMLLKHNIDCT